MFLLLLCTMVASAPPPKWGGVKNFRKNLLERVRKIGRGGGFYYEGEGVICLGEGKMSLSEHISICQCKQVNHTKIFSFSFIFQVMQILLHFQHCM